MTKQSYLKSAQMFAELMDNRFSILGIRFGIENIAGLIPGLGDALGFFFSFYLVWIGHQIGLPKAKVSQMVTNIVLDAVVGSIPFLGDLFDVFYKANMKNLNILQEYSHIEEAERIS